MAPTFGRNCCCNCLRHQSVVSVPRWLVCVRVVCGATYDLGVGWGHAVLRTGKDPGDNQWLWLGVAAVTGVCLVTTHHLTAYEAVVALLVLGLCDVIRKERVVAGWRILCCAAGLAALAIAWILVLRIPIVSYLKVFPVSAVHAIGPIFQQNYWARSSARSLYRVAREARRGRYWEGAHFRQYERLAGLVSQPLLAIACGCGVLSLWRSRATQDALGFGVIASAYFISLPPFVQ